MEPARIGVKRLPKYLTYAAGALRVSALPYRAVQLVSLRYAGYLAVSAISLGVDLASFFLMLQMNVAPVHSAMLGYAAGLVAHWFLSSRLIFADRVQPASFARSRQKLFFVISALVGLAITAAMIKCGLQLGIHPGLSKLAAIVVSFHATYFLRRTVVFR